jgi:hypothetical protein
MKIFNILDQIHSVHAAPSEFQCTHVWNCEQARGPFDLLSTGHLSTKEV